MKRTILLSTLCLLLAGGLQARTWTSSDGSRSFEGTLRSYNAETGAVTVVVNGRPMTFQEDKLSEADIAFLKEEEMAASRVDPTEALAATEVGKKVTKAKLHRLEGDRYKSAELDKAPDYYILYYSASW